MQQDRTDQLNAAQVGRVFHAPIPCTVMCAIPGLRSVRHHTCRWPPLAQDQGAASPLPIDANGSTRLARRRGLIARRAYRADRRISEQAVAILLRAHGPGGWSNARADAGRDRAAELAGAETSTGALLQARSVQDGDEAPRIADGTGPLQLEGLHADALAAHPEQARELFLGQRQRAVTLPVQAQGSPLHRRIEFPSRFLPARAVSGASARAG